jgi:hypothetical protein
VGLRFNTSAMSRIESSHLTISPSSSRSIAPRGAWRSACDEVRPCLCTQYDTVDGSRSTSRAIASIDAPDSNRSANHSRSTIRTLVRASDDIAAVGTIPFMTDDAVMRDELESAIEARKELGDEMEPAVIDAFVARIERRLVEHADRGERALQRKREHQKEMVLGSMAVSIPLLAIAAIFTGLAGVIAVCAALAVIAIVSSRG